MFTTEAENKPSIRCTRCGYSSKLQHHFKQHMGFHKQLDEGVSGIEQCSDCFKFFDSKKALKNHIKIHSDDTLVHGCDECGKRFRDTSNLKVHLLTHSGVKPFRCEVPGCNYACTTKQWLQRHYRGKHKLSNQEMPQITRQIPFTIEAYTKKNRSSSALENMSIDDNNNNVLMKEQSDDSCSTFDQSYDTGYSPASQPTTPKFCQSPVPTSFADFFPSTNLQVPHTQMFQDQSPSFKAQRSPEQGIVPQQMSIKQENVVPQQGTIPQQEPMTVKQEQSQQAVIPQQQQEQKEGVLPPIFSLPISMLTSQPIISDTELLQHLQQYQQQQEQQQQQEEQQQSVEQEQYNQLSVKQESTKKQNGAPEPEVNQLPPLSAAPAYMQSLPPLISAPATKESAAPLEQPSLPVSTETLPPPPPYSSHLSNTTSTNIGTDSSYSLAISARAQSFLEQLGEQPNPPPPSYFDTYPFAQYSSTTGDTQSSYAKIGSSFFDNQIVPTSNNVHRDLQFVDL